MTFARDLIKLCEDMETMPLSVAALNRLIVWTSSRYNPYRKQDVVGKAYRMLVSGKGTAVFGCGSYCPGTARNPSLMGGTDYLVKGPERELRIGYGDDVDGFETRRIVKFVYTRPQVPSQFKWKQTQRTIRGRTFVDNDLRWEGWRASYGKLADKDMLYWRVIDPEGNEVGRGEVGIDDVEIARSESERVLRQNLSKP